MSDRLLEHIKISADSQRFPSWVFFILIMIIFCLSLPFIRLLILEFQKESFEVKSKVFLYFILTTFILLEAWIITIYNTPKEIELRLFDDRLELSSALSPIPLKNIEVVIEPSKTLGLLNGVIFSQSNGLGLKIKIKDSARFLKPSFISQLSFVYCEQNQIQFLIGKMISKKQADSFLNYYYSLK